MQNDLRFLVAVGVAILLLVVIVRPLFWGGFTATEGAIYERPATVSQDVEDRALEHALLLVYEVEIRFDAERVCPSDADACVRDIDPQIIHLDQSLGEIALDQPGLFVTIVIHEAAHVYDLEHDLDLAPFREFDDIIEPREVFADCAAQAIVLIADPSYLECPEEGRLLALDILGIESVRLGWVGDRISLDVRR
ncbi:hypothetical protein [Microbacterium sp. Leaf436]|uniref:hypothetical protein n=1 Tax=Microbacterium sp. Leaf436 TaxID=1736377 RepID=UPI0012E3A487|nr:hypothetical protein [Microbacterium sp. Leaf436]